MARYTTTPGGTYVTDALGNKSYVPELPAGSITAKIVRYDAAGNIIPSSSSSSAATSSGKAPVVTGGMNAPVVQTAAPDFSTSDYSTRSTYNRRGAPVIENYAPDDPRSIWATTSTAAPRKRPTAPRWLQTGMSL